MQFPSLFFLENWSRTTERSSYSENTIKNLSIRKIPLKETTLPLSSILSRLHINIVNCVFLLPSCHPHQSPWLCRAAPCLDGFPRRAAPCLDGSRFFRPPRACRVAVTAPRRPRMALSRMDPLVTRCQVGRRKGTATAVKGRRRSRSGHRKPEQNLRLPPGRESPVAALAPLRFLALPCLNSL